MSRTYWIFALILIGGSISLFLTIFLLPSRKQNTSISLQNGQIPPTATPTPAFELGVPININDPTVFASSLVYTLSGTIVDIKTVPEGLELITDIKVANIPRFIVCITCQQQTQIYGTFQEGLRQVQYTMLAIGQNVRIVATYNLKTKEWTIPRVNISNKIVLPTSPPQGKPNQSASSSAR